MDVLNVRGAASRFVGQSFALAIATATAGCGVLGSPFTSGTYNGTAACTLTAGEGDSVGTQSFDTATTLEVLDSGALILNGTEIVVGQSISFSTPTADLAFEVTAVRRGLTGVVVEFEPRPTLPGISIDGTLTETFQRSRDGIDATAEADLDITDATATTPIHVSCEGTLVRE